MNAQEIFDNWNAYLRKVDVGDFHKQLMALQSSVDEWHPGSEKPWVSGWQWIDYWTPDGLPGCTRYTFGDPWDESGIACWRFRGAMPPYAAAPR